MSQARLTRRHAMAAVAVTAAAPLAFAQAPNAYKSLSYDPFKDFVPIVNAASFELAMVVHRDVPMGNVAAFVAWAKGQGDKVSFASYGAGTPSHFLGEMLNRAAGLQMVHVPYRGSTPARQDVMGGTVPLYFDTVGGAITMLPTGRVHARRHGTLGPHHARHELCRERLKR